MFQNIVKKCVEEIKIKTKIIKKKIDNKNVKLTDLYNRFNTYM